ncbi:MAG TPA: DUF4240 domain-containing protein [Kofleriaceae bacterium]|jgi:tetratricopeptide (TPR) repeat protein
MDHAGFWSTIGSAKNGTQLAKRLAKLAKREIVEFDAWFRAYYDATQRQDLWAAIYAIRGGCGDDGFDYFRAWLIGRGEAAVVAAIHNPESLAELVGRRNAEDESMLYAARRAYGVDLPDAPWPAIPGADAWPADRFASGVEWDDAFYAAHYPKLHARYIAGKTTPVPTGEISQDRFWQLIDDARGDSAEAATHALQHALRALALDELVGFDRWLSTYWHALRPRSDVRAVTRILFGKDDSDTVAGFGGWLLVQGRAAVAAATRDLDAVLVHARHPPTPNAPMLFVTWPPLEAHGIYSRSSPAESIPDVAAWHTDVDLSVASAAELRARFPRLTAKLSDVQLGADIDVTRFSLDDRKRYALERVARSRELADDGHRLVELDRAFDAFPTLDGLRFARGKALARLGRHADACADFDSALAIRPSPRVRWERAKSRDALGDRAGALADATSAAAEVDGARAWLAAQSAGVHRVRHAKFGDGTVVNASGDNLTIDFTSGRKTIARRFVEPIDG